MPTVTAAAYTWFCLNKLSSKDNSIIYYLVTIDTENIALHNIVFDIEGSRHRERLNHNIPGHNNG